MTLDHIAIKNAAESLQKRFGGVVIVNASFVASELRPEAEFKYFISVGMVTATSPNLNEAMHQVAVQINERAAKLEAEAAELRVRAATRIDVHASDKCGASTSTLIPTTTQINA